jgi:D-aminopeptidase
LETGIKSAARGFGAAEPGGALALALKNGEPANTSLAVVATDAPLGKAQAKRLAVMAQDGLALAIRPAHAPTDGDIVFAAATGRAAAAPDLADLTEIGMLAAECVARSVARAIYEAAPLAVEGAQPSWRQRYGR